MEDGRIELGRGMYWINLRFLFKTPLPEQGDGMDQGYANKHRSQVDERASQGDGPFEDQVEEKREDGDHDEIPDNVLEEGFHK